MPEAITLSDRDTCVSRPGAGSVTHMCQRMRKDACSSEQEAGKWLDIEGEERTNTVMLRDKGV